MNNQQSQIRISIQENPISFKNLPFDLQNNEELALLFFKSVKEKPVYYIDLDKIVANLSTELFQKKDLALALMNLSFSYTKFLPIKFRKSASFLFEAVSNCSGYNQDRDFGLTFKTLAHYFHPSLVDKFDEVCQRYNPPITYATGYDKVLKIMAVEEESDKLKRNNQNNLSEKIKIRL